MCRALVPGRPRFMDPTANRQLGDVRRDRPRLVPAHQLCVLADNEPTAGPPKRAVPLRKRSILIAMEQASGMVGWQVSPAAALPQASVAERQLCSRLYGRGGRCDYRR